MNRRVKLDAARPLVQLIYALDRSFPQRIPEPVQNGHEGLIRPCMGGQMNHNILCRADVKTKGAALRLRPLERIGIAEIRL